MRMFALGLLVSTALCTSSHAADMAAPEALEHDWSGFYVGAHVGYGWGDADFSANTNKYDFPDLFEDAPVTKNGEPYESYYKDADWVAYKAMREFKEDLGYSHDYPEFGWDDKADLEGFLGGGQVGYNIQSGRFVFGVEGDISFADISADSSFDLSTADDLSEEHWGAALGGDFSAEINWLSTIRGRVGFAFDRVLIFATGGLAVADIDFKNELYAAYVDCGKLYETSISNDDSDIQTGFVVGGGVEFAFAEKWSIKGEYEFIDLGDKTIDFDENTSSQVDLTLHVVKVGLNYHF